MKQHESELKSKIEYRLKDIKRIIHRCYYHYVEYNGNNLRLYIGTYITPFSKDLYKLKNNLKNLIKHNER